jgi:hypothetical protein
MSAIYFYKYLIFLFFKFFIFFKNFHILKKNIKRADLYKKAALNFIKKRLFFIKQGKKI